MPINQYRTLAICFLLLCFMGASTGCSIWMAWEGKRGIDPNVDLQPDNLVGLSQQEVEAKFGRPSISEPLAEGKVVATYNYEVLKSPNRVRALIWFLLDVVSLGIWEIPGSLIEYQMEKKTGEVAFTYGPDNRVEKVEEYEPDQTELAQMEKPDITFMKKSPLGLPNAGTEHIKQPVTDQSELVNLDKSDNALPEERPLAAPLSDPTQTVSLSLFVGEGVNMPENDHELFLDTVRRGLVKEGFIVTSDGDIKIIGKVMTYVPPDLFTRRFGIALETGYFNSSWVALDKDNKEFFKGKFEGTFQLGLFNPNDSMERAAENVIKMLLKAPHHY